MNCRCKKLEELRDYKAETQKLLAKKEADLVQLGRRCGIAEDLVVSQGKKIAELEAELTFKRIPLPPLVTDNPTNNVGVLLNYAYAKDGEVYLRYANGKTDVNLAEYICHLAAEKGCGTHTKEEVLNGDVCFACDCEVAILNTVAVQAAELRGRLKKHEDQEGN